MLKPSRLQYAPGLLLLVLLCTTVASAATGTVLADFIPGGKLGNGKGLAFDGTYLYYTINDDSNIYKITTKGALVATSPIQGGVAQGGPLA